VGGVFLPQFQAGCWLDAGCWVLVVLPYLANKCSTGQDDSAGKLYGLGAGKYYGLAMAA